MDIYNELIKFKPWVPISKKCLIKLIRDKSVNADNKVYQILLKWLRQYIAEINVFKRKMFPESNDGYRAKYLEQKQSKSNEILQQIEKMKNQKNNSGNKPESLKGSQNDLSKNENSEEPYDYIHITLSTSMERKLERVLILTSLVCCLVNRIDDRDSLK